MATSFVRLFALAPLFALWACAPLVPAGGTRVSFAVTSAAPALEGAAPAASRVGERRVLSRHVNLQEPIRVAAADGAITVTFAVRQLDGLTMAIDATSLAARATTPFAYAAHARYDAPPHLAPDSSRVRLADGTSVSFWNDDEGSVVAQAFDADGSAHGEPIAVSPAGMHVLGAPRAATADGRHVVVAFLACGEDGFDLVAASFDGS